VARAVRIDDLDFITRPYQKQNLGERVSWVDAWKLQLVSAIPLSFRFPLGDVAIMSEQVEERERVV
jgi:hypothetical protein